MAAVYRDEPSIVILEGTALDTKEMEVKDDDGAQEDWCGMEAKSDEEEATQAGECHMRDKEENEEDKAVPKRGGAA